MHRPSGDISAARPCLAASGQISCHALNPQGFTLHNGEGRERNPPRETPQAGDCDPGGTPPPAETGPEDRPGPQRGEGSWDEFLKIHAKTLWACDFLSKKIWTKWGLAEFFILFLIHVGSRRVYVSGMTTHPDTAWVAQQARNFGVHLAERGEEASYLIHDRDKKFTAQFDAMLESEGITIKEPIAKSPNLNAFAERWAQSVQVECLDHFVVLGEDHLRYLVSEYVDYFNPERPPQAMDHCPLTGSVRDSPSEGEILCRERLGGLLRHYHRQAA